MNRPVMHTMLLDGVKPPPPKPSAWRHALAPFRWAWAVLMFDPFHRGPRLHVEDGSTAAGRFVRWVLYRALLLPVLFATVVCSTVWIGTHPRRAGYVTADPGSQGLHYENLPCPGPEDTSLEAWFVPLLDPKAVIEHGTGALKRKQPAVVLVHDHTANRMQMLPLIRPFHEAGFYVMVVSLRGSAPVESPTTFGLAESEDVLAAVEVLRRQKGVDPARIAILGTGTGANAARVAARQDSSIAALVLDEPTLDVDALVADHLAPREPWLAFARPACKWAFDIAYKHNLDDLEGRPRHAAVFLTGREGVPSCFSRPGVDAARTYLARTFGMEPPPPADGPTATATP